MKTITNDISKVLIAPIEKFEEEGGVCAKVGDKQIAIFYFKSREEWFACDNACPHTGEMALSKGMIGDSKGEPKVTCPIHKRSFSLHNGECMTEENLKVNIYSVIIQDGMVYLDLNLNNKIPENKE